MARKRRRMVFNDFWNLIFSRHRRETNSDRELHLSIEQRLREGIGELRENLQAEIIENRLPIQRKSYNFLEARMKIEVIRCVTILMVVCVAGACYDPQTMVPYLDKLVPTFAFLVGYFFPSQF